MLSTYWQGALRRLEDDEHDYKQHQLPLARIKKVMKADPEVKMISAEAPILFAKGCEIFITELTMRAWIHAEENKRRTLQRSDIASALTKSDMFDFLIDVVPREEANAAHSKRPTTQSTSATAGNVRTSVPPAQQQQAAAAHHTQHPPGPADYQAFQQHLPTDGEYRPGTMYVPSGGEGVYPAQPGAIFDQNLYTGYHIPQQQVSRPSINDAYKH